MVTSTKQLSILITLSLIFGVACATQPRRTASYKDQVKTALEQADLRDVSVSDDAQKNTLTLSGTVHSDEAKNKAGDIAKANAGNRVIANEISVQPVQESASKESASTLDAGIEKNYKAALIQKGLDKRHIRFDAKNGVLTLKGSVPNPQERREAQELAQNTPNVAQVVNQIEVRR